MKLLSCIALLAVVVLGSGCAAGARVVRGDAHGGTLEAWGPLVPATQHARLAMAEHCGGRYVLRSEAPTRGAVSFACGVGLQLARR